MSRKEDSRKEEPLSLHPNNDPVRRQGIVCLGTVWLRVTSGDFQPHLSHFRSHARLGYSLLVTRRLHVVLGCLREAEARCCVGSEANVHDFIGGMRKVVGTGF